jgi:hypothetical protein
MSRGLITWEIADAVNVFSTINIPKEKQWLAILEKLKMNINEYVFYQILSTNSLIP